MSESATKGNDNDDDDKGNDDDDDNNKNKNEEKEIKRLTNNPLRLAVLRLGMTELKGTSMYNYGTQNGRFDCAYCGEELFDSDGKFDSKSGWPSFWRSANDNAMAYKREFDGRIECKCKTCNSHLGHVFMDGPRESSVDIDVLNSKPYSDPVSKVGGPNGRLPRFCINGACLNLKEEK